MTRYRVKASRKWSCESARCVTALALCVLGLFLLVLAPVSAQASSDPTAAQYQDAAALAGNDAGRGPTPPANQNSTSGLQQPVVAALPFTGFDLIALVAVALALASVGFALRSLTAGRERHSK